MEIDVSQSSGEVSFKWVERVLVFNQNKNFRMKVENIARLSKTL